MYYQIVMKGELLKNLKTLSVLIICIIVIGGLAILSGPNQSNQKEADQTVGQENSDSDDVDIVVVDLETFEVLGEGYSKDKNNVYYKMEIITAVDPKTFEILKYTTEDGRYYPYSKDKNNVYYNREIITGADPATFEILKNSYFTIDDYFKDKNNVYHYNGEIIHGADLATFEVLKDGYSKHKNNIYY